MSTRDHKDSVLPALVLVAALGVVYGVLSRFALQGFPYSGDEYSCFLQAELFARGLLRAPAPAHAALLRVDHVVIDAWVRSKYPPGTAALLALGVRAGAPWLVAPLEAVVTLVAVWRTALAHFGARSGVIAVVAMGLCPLFALQASTFYGHTPTTMWLALAMAAVSLWLRTKASVWPVLGGVALGCALMTRPADAAFFGVALLALRSRRVLLLTAVGLLPFVGLHFVYQAAQFGSPWTDGYHAYEPTFRALYGQAGRNPLSLRYLVDPLQLANHLDVLRALVTEWTLPGSVLLAIVGARAVGPDHPARPVRDLALAIAAVTCGMLFVSIADPDDGARPRYLSTTVLTIALLAGPGWDAALDALRGLVGRRLAQAAIVFALLSGPVAVGAFVGRRIPDVWVREGLFDEVATEGITDGVVLVRAEWPSRYARNGPFFDRPVLYLSAPPSMTADQVAALYPGRRVYEATEGRSWKLVRRL